MAIAIDSRREKTNKLSPRRKARKGVWGKNKINIEVLCGLCASARGKNNNSRQGAKHAKVFGVKTKLTSKFSTASAPPREKKNKSRRGAENAEKIVLLAARMQYRSIRGM